MRRREALEAELRALGVLGLGELSLTRLKNTVRKTISMGGIPAHVYNFAAKIAEACRLSAGFEDTSATIQRAIQNGTPRWRIYIFSNSIRFEITTTPTTVTIQLYSKYPQSARNIAQALKDEGIISDETEGTKEGFPCITYTFADPKPKPAV
jgi:hypothetical protein